MTTLLFIISKYLVSHSYLFKFLKFYPTEIILAKFYDSFRTIYQAIEKSYLSINSFSELVFNIII